MSLLVDDYIPWLSTSDNSETISAAPNNLAKSIAKLPSSIYPNFAVVVMPASYFFNIFAISRLPNFAAYIRAVIPAWFYYRYSYYYRHLTASIEPTDAAIINAVWLFSLSIPTSFSW